MSVTLPQIIMLNFEGWREAETMRLRREANSPREDDPEDPFIPEYNCKLSEVKKDPKKFSAYMASGW